MLDGLLADEDAAAAGSGDHALPPGSVSLSVAVLAAELPVASVRPPKAERASLEVCETGSRLAVAAGVGGAEAPASFPFLAAGIALDILGVAGLFICAGALTGVVMAFVVPTCAAVWCRPAPILLAAGVLRLSADLGVPTGEAPFAATLPWPGSPLPDEAAAAGLLPGPFLVAAELAAASLG